MHDYSLDIPARRNAHVVLALASLSAPPLVASLADLLSVPPEFVFSVSFGLMFLILHFLFDKYLWKWLPIIPDLNGTWKAEGKSSYIDPDTGKNFQFEMQVKIRQTFSEIEFYTETKESTSRSFMASIELRHAVPILSYGFDNTPKNMANPELQRHPGMIQLRITSSKKLEGDYFSGKHRLKYGELTLKRN